MLLDNTSLLYAAIVYAALPFILMSVTQLGHVLLLLIFILFSHYFNFIFLDLNHICQTWSVQSSRTLVLKSLRHRTTKLGFS